MARYRKVDSHPSAIGAAQIHFLSNTHLDREWTMDFEHTRALTVEFLDQLIPLMQQVPHYQFLLDSQAVPLEDYAEMRPENLPALSALIRAGRVHVGPWYTALDMNCLSGEAVTRNMLWGHLVAEAHGPVMKVGYTPFGFGQISQLPQIYREFGIDTCIFYRGITAEQAPKAEFVWIGADGAELLCSRLGPGGRSAFYFHVWRPACYAGRTARLRRECDWRTEPGAFKLCDDDNRFDHGAVLQPRRTLNARELRRAFRDLIEQSRPVFTTPHLPFAHGMDTSMPDPLEDAVLKQCQRYLRPGERFFHSSLPQYMAAVRAAVDRDRLVHLRGEMKFYHIYLENSLAVANDIVSARSRQKQLTAKVDNLLTRVAEPFAAMAYLLGVPWPQKQLELAWKNFLKCHAHDTIGGCGIDRIEEDATYRLREAVSLGNLVLKESLGAIQSRINTSAAKPDEIVLTVFNPSPFPRTEVAHAYVDYPRELQMRHVRLVDERGRAVPFTAQPTGHYGKVFRDKTDLALFSHADEQQFSFLAADVPPLGYRTYRLQRAAQPTRLAGKISTKPRLMENEHLRVRINRDGTLDIWHKETGRFGGVHYFEDTGEVGHAWTHLAPAHDEVVLSRGKPARIEPVANNALFASYRVTVTLLVPEDSIYPPNPVAEYQKTRRSKKKKPLVIESVFTLARGARSVDVRTRFDNACRNHRLRVLFPTDLATDESWADTPYDVVQRRIPRDEANPYRKFPYLTFNFLKFASLSDGRAGFTFLGNGLREYEAVDDTRRTLAITLLRACDVRMCTTSYSVLETRPGDLCQCQGRHEFHYRLCPHRGDWQAADMMQEAERLNYPLLVAESRGQRGGKLPARFGFLELTGAGLVLSAVKKSDRGDALIVRLYNSTAATATGQLRFFRPIRSARRMNMNEEPVAGSPLPVHGRVVRLTVPAKKVVTLALTF